MWEVWGHVERECLELGGGGSAHPPLPNSAISMLVMLGRDVRIHTSSYRQCDVPRHDPLPMDNGVALPHDLNNSECSTESKRLEA